VAELGSVFDEQPDDRPRGPDLRVSIEVPRAALGASLRAPVPARLAHAGDLVERVTLANDTPGYVELHLPHDLPERAQLRLRGQGGVHPDGRPGDLLVLTQIVDRAPRPDEHISVAATAVPEPDAGHRLDVTLWVLLGLALLTGGVLLAIAV
jgi:hypothetical protein